jgi:hypothetical protein
VKLRAFAPENGEADERQKGVMKAPGPFVP